MINLYSNVQCEIDGQTVKGTVVGLRLSKDKRVLCEIEVNEEMTIIVPRAYVSPLKSTKLNLEALKVKKEDEDEK